MRRFTPRSRFRACQSLQFSEPRINELNSTMASDKQIDLISLTYIRNFVFCLAELHELRLPCADTTIAHAIGLRGLPDEGSNGQSIEATSQDFNSCNPCPLINTWLHDEGEHADVCELARDVLVVSNWSNLAIWCTLITHMHNKNFMRAIINTFSILRNKPFFYELVSRIQIKPIVSSAVLNTFNIICLKSDQVFKFISICYSLKPFIFYLQIVDVIKNRISNTKEPSSEIIPVSKLSESVNNFSLLDLSSVNAHSSSSGNKTISSQQQVEKSKRHVSLVGQTRCYTSGKWDEAPEDLCLLISTIQMLWNVAIDLLDSSRNKRISFLRGVDAGILRLIKSAVDLEAINKVGDDLVNLLCEESISFAVKYILRLKFTHDKTYAKQLGDIISLLCSYGSEDDRVRTVELQILRSVFQGSSLCVDTFLDKVCDEVFISKYQTKSQSITKEACIYEILNYFITALLCDVKNNDFYYQNEMILIPLIIGMNRR